MSELLRGIKSNHNGHFYCLNCFHSYRTENKFKKHCDLCRNHDYCHVEMPEEDNKMSKYNHGEKSMKHPFIICADLEFLLKKNGYLSKWPPKMLYRKKNKHKASGYSIFTHCSFDVTKNKLDCYRGNDCM